MAINENDRKLATITIIAAIQKTNRGIGKDNKLLWQISNDLKRFKALTLNHPIIMGRKTYESIGRPLPKRTNIVVTSNLDFKAEGCVICHSVGDALQKAQDIDQTEMFIIGGSEIFKMTINIVDKLCLTIVDDESPADVFFPEYSQFTKETFREDHPPERSPAYSFVNLER